MDWMHRVARPRLVRALAATAASLLAMQTTAAWALSQACNAPNVQQSFVSSAVAGQQLDVAQPFSFTVPPGVTSLTIDAIGGQGGSATSSLSTGGFGAEVAATVSVTPGNTLCIVAGVRGATVSIGQGGGGSFVYTIQSGTCQGNMTNVGTGNLGPQLLVAAGGGGGGGMYNPKNGGPGLASGLSAGTAGAINGGDGNVASGGGANSIPGTGGTGGNGGGAAGGGGGGGLLSYGADSTTASNCDGGASLRAGAKGSDQCFQGGTGSGGYGGGGGGAGGGYNGGGGAAIHVAGGGGGGSYSIVSPIYAHDGQLGHGGNGEVDLCYTPAKLDQTINFTSTAPTSAVVGSTYTPAATATSGLAVSFSVSGVCSFDGTNVTFTAVGTCNVKADQSGNSGYNAAPEVEQTISVGKATPTVTASAAPATAKAGQSVSVTANIMPPAGVTASGTVTFKEGSKALSDAIAVSSNKARASLSSLTIGSHTITAWYTGDGNLLAGSATTRVKVNARVGAETKVNTTTIGSQQLPAVAALKSGYVVVWASNANTASGFDIRAQRYTSAGAKAGSEIAVNKTTGDTQTMPAVAGLKNGTFVVAWQSAGQDGSGTGVYAQRFSATGGKLGGEFKVNSVTANDQGSPAIAALDDGGFVAVWTSAKQDGAGLGVYGRRFDASGKTVGAAFAVNKTTAGDQSAPVVAGLSGGGFVAAWQGPDAAGLGIFARLFDANGVGGSELKVNSVTANDQSQPTVAALDSGGFVVGWQSALQDGSGLGIYMQLYKPTGVKVSGNKLVNTATAGNQSAPAASGFKDGGFIVTWVGQDGSGQGIFAQAFNDSAKAVNSEFRANTTKSGTQSQPAVAAFTTGKFVMVWSSAGQDGSKKGVYAQRFQILGVN